MKTFERLRAIFLKDDGSSLVELAVVFPILMLLLLGAVDFSRGYHLSMQVAGAAHAGAEYGVGNKTDTAGIIAAATSDAADVPNLTIASPTYGCECSDGSSSSANCSTSPACTYNVVYWVKVKASATFKPVFPWPGLPSTITISKSATMRTGS